MATTGRAATGNAIPAMARPLPFRRPPLLRIITRLIMPRIMAGIAVKMRHGKLKRPNMNEVMAIRLVFAPGAGPVEMLVRTQLHELHNCAPSAFSFPHFGQYIFAPFEFGFDVAHLI
jgi:hypothetical protein